MFRFIPNSQVDQPGRHSGNVGYTGLIWQDYVNRLLIELCYKAYRDKDMGKSSDTYRTMGGVNLSDRQVMQNKPYSFKNDLII